MTQEEYLKKYDEYSKKAEYYRKKLVKLQSDFFDEQNKDNWFMQRLKEYTEDK